MGILSKLTDPLGLKKKARKAVGIKEDPMDPFGHIKKLEDKAKDALGYDFEKFHFKQIWKDLKDNPERALFGSFDPLSTKMWNEVLGRSDKPIIGQMGGPAAHRYADYIAAGGDPKAAEKAATAHQVAGAIASWYAGGALSQLAGQGASALGSQAATRAASTLTPTTTAGLVSTGAGALEAAVTPESAYGPTPWDPGPGEYLGPPLTRPGRRFLGVVDPYRYGQVGGEQQLFGSARGGLARVARRRYR